MAKRRNFVFALGTAALVGIGTGAMAQAGGNPGQPVRLVVAFPPGGPADTIARTLAPHLGQAWQRPVIVENKPGAGGSIAAGTVLREAPDGGTLLFTSTTHLQAIGLKLKLTYDPVKDFVPITKIGNGPLVLAVRTDGPATLKAFVEAARAKPLSLASFGSASTGHIYGEILAKETGIKLLNVPYAGGAPAVTALLGGHVDGSFIEVTQALPLLKAGKVKPLAIIGARRHTQLPDVQTFGELGMPGFELVGFHAVLARAGTPKEVVQRVSDGLQAALVKPDVRARLQDLGLELVGNTAAHWESSFADEARQWTRLIERAGVTAE